MIYWHHIHFIILNKINPELFIQVIYLLHCSLYVQKQEDNTDFVLD